VKYAPIEPEGALELTFMNDKSHHKMHGLIADRRKEHKDDAQSQAQLLP